ncbi:LysR family transcriptional regulator [Cupriavidus pauculus]|uniref:LysR family transcriptional regulator n=1 Tax=Cupriavidus pauculus TaxID=82633 RepID=A0A2N5CB14_9BURK|nr:LysR family transcriptional regulator [Cupriavidus pauculus]PLP99409.1 LysR family transcriptional regulator [Cupriavidus pauculus]
MNVTLKQLEAFYFSVTSTSFTVAAAKLFTTQSAVSKRVIELEQALGVQLVHRMPKGLVPTQAGARLIPIAEESMALRERIAREVGLDNEVRGTFRIGVTELVALTWLTRLLRELKSAHPALEIEPVVDAGMNLFSALEANTIDLTILPGTYWGDAYQCVEVGRVEDLWMASPKLGIPDRPLKPDELAEYPVLEQAAGSAKNAFYGPWNREHGFRFKKVFSTNSLTVLRALTIEGLGISQLAVDYFASDINAGLLRVVRTDPMPPPLIYSAVYRPSGFSRALDVIAETAGHVCNFKRGPFDLAESPIRMMR